MKHLAKRGNAAHMAVTIASTALVLIVTSIVLGSLFTTAVENTGATTSDAGLAVGNVSAYTWQAIILLSVGLLIAAGFSLMMLLTHRK